MKKFFKVVAVIIAAVCCFAGCSKTPQEELAGRWKSDKQNITFKSLEFFKDGTYTSNSSNYEGDYSISGDRIKLEGVLAESKTYTYEILDDTLVFYDNNGDVYAEYKRVEQE